MDVPYFRYDRHVFLPGPGMWLDSTQPRDLAFISHAHSDHIATHDEIVVSERTARLLLARLPAQRIEHVLPFGEGRTVHDIELMGGVVFLEPLPHFEERLRKAVERFR